MNFPFYIARRYLVSKKTHNIINIISGISVIGVMVGTMALIVVLSVFNGFEKAVISMFNVFDPDLQISLAEGKTFHQSELPSDKISHLPGVVRYTQVLEENGLLRYKDKQYLAVIKGVSAGYEKNSPLDTLIVEGKMVLQADSFDFAIPGFGIAYYLGVQLDDPENLISIYVPDRTKRLNVLSENTLRSETIMPAGIFSVQQDFDNKYMFVPLRFARRLLNYSDEISSAEIWLAPGSNAEETQQTIEKWAGKKFVVKNRLQQQDILYKTMKSEKWAVFLILTFILIIATFNVIGSITMLILDKRRDIHVLGSMGASQKLIRRIFFTEGALIIISGALSGSVLGFIICWVQKHFELIKLGNGGSFILNAYPVDMKVTDFIMVIITVTFIGLAACWLPVRRMSRRFEKTNSK
ncbi:MAG: FtsX-like permease family protein [Bacteroidetes bacterium]|nr:FtsX-like permease family protein [Bacteroidota bacterium]